MKPVKILQKKPSKKTLSLYLLLALCFNLAIAPAIYAATGEDLTRKAAYALGILVLVTIALSIYLFTVIFQPERF